MPACIQRLGSEKPDQEHWVDRCVLRIGSDPDADLRLPGVEAHAVTLIFRERKYFAMNRTTRELRIKARALPAGQSAVWRPGEEMTLTESIRLRLLATSDPAPAPRPCAPFDFEPFSAMAQGTPTHRYVAWTLAVAGAIALCVLHVPRHAAPSASDRVATIVAQLRHGPLDLAPRRARQSQLLQIAYSLEATGNASAACHEYAALRDTLLLLRDSSSSTFGAPEQALLDFVRERLQVTCSDGLPIR